MSLKKDINFSLWCDFIEREFLEGQFQDLIEQNVIHGATSNPAIFASSISNSFAYKQQLVMLQANNEKRIYEELAIKDITRAASLLEHLYEENENDGFICLEVDPFFSDDSEATIEEGLRLYNSIGKDNVMIKVPATEAGFKSMKKLTSLGIHVNATLVFSPEQAINATKALNEGIKESNRNTKAVVSIFVSRFDRLCDLKFASKSIPTGRLGIINATKCYHKINEFKNSNIRTLFASTAVKGDDLEQTYYVDNLLFPNSINTAPLNTIEEYIKDGKSEESEILSLEECEKFFVILEKNGVDIEDIYNELLNDGLESLKTSFKDLLSKLLNH